jgi:long-chain acyl-CoA synthetase
MLACTCNPVGGLHKAGSVGLPLPDVDIDIVDVESGERSLTVGEMGEVVIRGPQLMPTYWQNAPTTAEALRRRDADGPWLYTGDLGYMDDDGHLFLVDRKTDMIKSSGIWHPPSQQARQRPGRRKGGCLACHIRETEHSCA